MSIYSLISKKSIKKTKKFAVLIDPDKTTAKQLENITVIANRSNVDFFFVGGSLLTNDSLEITIRTIKDNSNIPVVLFPGNTMQINKNADALLLLSLISGRNPEMLIGNHVIAAPYLKQSKLEIISTGYMLIESGKPTTALYMSNSTPIPSDKDDIAVCTAIAGEMLGLKLIYLEAGSGAKNTLTFDMVKGVKENISIPLIVGGGLKTSDDIKNSLSAGADIVVVGTAIENDSKILKKLVETTHAFNI